jgi:Na+/melibiose symporter-like transporter
MRRRVRPRRLRPWIIACAVPTVLTIVLEWTAAASVGNVVRAIAALPLGGTIALAIVLTAAGESSKSNRVN